MENCNLVYQFGDWSVHPHLNRVSMGNVENLLEPRTMDVLRCLLQSPGDVVSTEEILKKVWSNRPAEPHMVAKRISQIRRVLDDNVKNPNYIATVSKRGYRTVCPVTEVDLSATSSSSITPADIPKKAHPDDVQSRANIKVGEFYEGGLTPLLSPTSFYKYKNSIEFWSGLLTITVLIGFIGFLFVKAPVNSSSSDGRVIAVLPLDNLSADPSYQYIADGLTEEITTELGKLTQLHVISRTSVMRYFSERPSVKQIAKELDINYLIEGSVAREGDQIRVTIQLIDAVNDHHLWAHSFDSNASSILDLRTEIARNVATNLKLLDQNAEQQFARDINVNEEAYDAYLRGISQIGPLEQFMDWSPKAIMELNKAVTLEPNFAEAWGNLALIKTVEAVWVDDDQFVVVKEFADKALLIDKNTVTGYTALGYLELLQRWNPITAEAFFERALHINPNDKNALQGQLINLAILERTDESMQVLNRLRALNPRDFTQRVEQVRYLYNMRYYERALVEAENVRAIWPDYWDFVEAASYHQLGRYRESHQARLYAYQKCGTACEQLYRVAEEGWNTGGYEGSLRALANVTFQENERGLYWLKAQLGEMDAAISLAENLVKERTPWLVGIHYHPDFDAIRTEASFESILDSVSVPKPVGSIAREADVARLMAFRGQAEKAIEKLQRTMNAKPEDARYPRWLESTAWGYFAAEEYEFALQTTHELLDRELTPHAETIALLLASASYAHLYQLDDSKSSLNLALQNSSGHIDKEVDLAPYFIGGNENLENRFFEGLRVAGFNQKSFLSLSPE